MKTLENYLRLVYLLLFCSLFFMTSCEDDGIENELEETACVLKLTFDSSDGELAAMVSGGVEPYSYSWSSGEGTATIAINEGVQYELNVTDSKGCSAKAMWSELCESLSVLGYTDDNSITADATGGTPPYDYLWSTGETTRRILQDESMYYEITVTDAAGCVATTSDCVHFWAKLQNNISGVLSPVTTHQASGSLSFLWSTGETSETIHVSTPGVYQVTVTNAHGCARTSECSFDPEACDAFVVETLIAPLHGVATIRASASGGLTGYDYIWSKDGLVLTEDSPNVVLDSDCQLFNYINVTSGHTYSLEVTDQQGCTYNETFVIP